VGVKLNQLAALVQGTVHGDGDVLIESARPVRDANPGSITFLEHEKLARTLNESGASAVVMPAALAARRDEILKGVGPRMAVLEVADSLVAFIQIVGHLHPAEGLPPAAIDPNVSIHPNARLGADCSAGAFTTVGAGSVVGNRCRLYDRVSIGRNCRLGDEVVLYPGVVLYDGTVLGNRVILHANVVIGADGFGYRLQRGRHAKMPQLGHVVVDDDVEIGAGTTIDRGTFGATRIGAGTKIDNHVQVGHNCNIGKHNLIVSQVGIAGSCSTGDYVVIAGQVGIADHVHIGDGAVLGARAGVHRDVSPGERILGVPGRPENEEKRILFSLERLPELRRDVIQIKKQLGQAS
jgi:UDP-3-O-[3-hydroxymyristoyl] glucosamine N-acyltransferase